MAYDPVRYQHHDRRVSKFVRICLDAYSESHRLKTETGYYDTGWQNADPKIKELDRLADRLSLITDRASRQRDRFASTERWTPYRAWPY